MASEFWQRLREARKFANKTQMEVAKAVGVTRSGYAFWENDDPTQRTRPNSDQVVVLSKLLKVPIGWLLNDSADVADLWRGKAAGVAAEPPAPQYTPTPAPAQVNPDRAQQRFWAAVEYLVTSADPGKDACFGIPVRAGAIELQADYLYENTAAVFSRHPGDAELLQTIGYLMVLAKAARMRDPKLVLLVKSDQAPAEGVVESARRFLGVQVSHVETPEQAAAALA